MQISRRTAYAVCAGQLAVTLAVVLYFPSVKVQVFTCHPEVHNGTADLSAPAPIRGATVMMGIPLLAASALVAMFSHHTVSLGGEGGGVLAMDYARDALEQTGLWDTLFWAHCTVAHTIVVLMVTSPGDGFAAALSGLLLAFFLHRACAPRSSELQLTQENMNLLGYSAGALIAVYSAPAGGTRISALFVMVVLDYVMGLGHTHDRQATLDTITNCRLFYVSSASLCLAAMYGAWEDRLLAG